MSEPLISIVIPAYNAEKHIQQTLDSLLVQSTSEVEVIVVDDGSSDGSLTLLKSNYLAYIQSEQLVVHTQPNQGVSAARNLGVDYAKGRYIGFMDADDVAASNYINTLLQAITKQTDIIEFGFKKFVDVDPEREGPPAYSNSQFGQHDVLDVFNEVYGKAKWYPWTRLFRRELLNGVRFPVGVSFCEDLMTIPQLYEKAQTILVLRDAIYKYRTNLTSATYSIKDSYIDHLVSFYNTIPKSGGIRYDYLRFSVAFAITSCQTKATGKRALPIYIQSDLNKLRWTMSLYQDIAPRKVAVMLYPTLYNVLMNTLRFLKRK